MWLLWTKLQGFLIAKNALRNDTLTIVISSVPFVLHYPIVRSEKSLTRGFQNQLFWNKALSSIRNGTDPQLVGIEYSGMSILGDD